MRKLGRGVCYANDLRLILFFCLYFCIKTRDLGASPELFNFRCYESKAPNGEFGLYTAKAANVRYIREREQEGR